MNTAIDFLIANEADTTYKQHKFIGELPEREYYFKVDRPMVKQLEQGKLDHVKLCIMCKEGINAHRNVKNWAVEEDRKEANDLERLLKEYHTDETGNENINTQELDEENTHIDQLINTVDTN